MSRYRPPADSSRSRITAIGRERTYTKDSYGSMAKHFTANVVVFIFLILLTPELLVFTFNASKIRADLRAALMQ